MSDVIPSLADQALQKLRKLSEGNGLEPNQIEITLIEEDIFKIEGTLTLAPKCKIETGHYPGPVRGKDRIVLPSLPALHAEVGRRREQFESGREWVEASIKELKAAPGQGWGLSNALVTQNDKPVILAASGGCPQCEARGLITCNQCHGQGTVLCNLCNGRGQEVCPICKGRGENPFQPGQPCTNCRGTRISPCRQCQARGQMVCPTCGGRRGTPCPACKGTGKITEETAITCGAETQFKLGNASLPSGARRGLDRLGVANLSKGHADITILPPKTDESDDPSDHEKTDDGKSRKKAVDPILHYEALLPYADLRVTFGDKKALIGAFGKHCALLNVPSFLDDALAPWREKLKVATHDRRSLDKALKAKAIRDALSLTLDGKGNLKEFRRLYPLGLSPDVSTEILKNVASALKHTTFYMRTIASVFCSLLALSFFYGLFFTSLYGRIAISWDSSTQFLFGMTLPFIMMSLFGLLLIASTRLALQRHFPGTKISFRQKIGKSGYAMLLAIFLEYLCVLVLAPTKPFWFLWLLAHLGL